MWREVGRQKGMGEGLTFCLCQRTTSLQVYLSLGRAVERDVIKSSDLHVTIWTLPTRTGSSLPGARPRKSHAPSWSLALASASASSLSSPLIFITRRHCSFSIIHGMALYFPSVHVVFVALRPPCCGLASTHASTKHHYNHRRRQQEEQ